MKVKYIGGAPLPFLIIGEVFDVIKECEGKYQISAGWFEKKCFEVV